jgi:hypothetical protein
MITLAKLRPKPRHFQAFCGLSVAEFDQLLAQLTPAYLAAQQQKQERSERQRSAGAGHKFSLALPERLLMGLMSLRLYVGQNLLSYLFDLDQSNLSRELHGRLLPVLLQLLPVPLREAPLRHLAKNPPDPSEAIPGQTGKRAPRINTLQELLAAYPEREAVWRDATEQSVPQFQDKQARKLRYSGKQQDHTVKTPIVATRTVILHVFGGLPGSLSDQTLLGASGVLRQVPPKVSIRLDKGYEGTAKRHPDRQVAQPVKGQRNHQVTVLRPRLQPCVVPVTYLCRASFCTLAAVRDLAGSLSWSVGSARSPLPYREWTAQLPGNRQVQSRVNPPLQDRTELAYLEGQELFRIRSLEQGTRVPGKPFPVLDLIF